MTPPGDSTTPYVAGQGLDPMTPCGLDSAHPTLALRNLLQFANSLRDRSMLPCFCIARQTHVLPGKMRPSPFLWRCHGWVGWGTKIFCRLFSPVGEAAFAASCAQGCLTAVA